MEETKSPLKSRKPARSGGGRTPSRAQRENAKTPNRNRNTATRGKNQEENLTGTGGGKTIGGTLQEPGKARARRLTGRTGSGERGKGQEGRMGGRSSNQNPLGTKEENVSVNRASKPAARDRQPGDLYTYTGLFNISSFTRCIIILVLFYSY